MKINEFEGVTLEETLEKAEYSLKLKQKDFIYKTEETKEGLFKGKKVKISVLTNKEIIDYVKDFLKQLTKKMGIDIKLEVKQKDNEITFMIFTNQSPILIGKQGRTINSIQTIIRQAIYNKTGFTVNNMIIDVEYYKAKHKKNLEKLANQLADEVEATKVEVKLDDMNAYDRKIIHNALMNRDEIYTESEGEEPTRHIVIKPNI